MNGENKGLTMQQIKFSDWNEYSSEGYKIFANKKEAEGAEKEFLNLIAARDVPFSHDYVREYEMLILQAMETFRPKNTCRMSSND